MEWFIGAYALVGVYKAWGALQADAPDKPVWMYSQKNPILWGLYFVMYVLLWPIAGAKS